MPNHVGTHARDQLMDAIREVQVMAGISEAGISRLRISRPAGSDLAGSGPIPAALGTRAFKSIRGGAGSDLAEDRPRPLCIGVTSCDYQDGKSTFAMALASSLAHDFAAEVMLVDADFQTHSLGREYGLEGRPGLSDVLAGEYLIGQVAYRYRGAPLSVVTSGTRLVDSSRLSRSGRFGQALDDMKRSSSFVVLDLPAALRTSNAAVVGSRCDGVILVVRAGHTTGADLAKVLRLLHDVNVIGVVINRQKSSVPGWAERLLGLTA